MNELYKAIDETLIHETKHISSWDESRRDQLKNIIVNRERVIPAILDAVIAALPKDKEAVDWASDYDERREFKISESSYLEAIENVKAILQSAKENTQ